MPSYLQDLAALSVTVEVFAGMEHAQRHTVQQDDQHGRSLKPRMGWRLRTTEKRQQTEKLNTLSKVTTSSVLHLTRAFFFSFISKNLQIHKRIQDAGKPDWSIIGRNNTKDVPRKSERTTVTLQPASTNESRSCSRFCVWESDRQQKDFLRFSVL